MIGRASHSQRNAGVLDRVVVINEQRAGRADIGLLRVMEQMLQPVRGNDLRVVVQEDQEITGGGRGALIVRAGKLKGSAKGMRRTGYSCMSRSKDSSVVSLSMRIISTWG